MQDEKPAKETLLEMFLNDFVYNSAPNVKEHKEKEHKETDINRNRCSYRLTSKPSPETERYNKYFPDTIYNAWADTFDNPVLLPTSQTPFSYKSLYYGDKRSFADYFFGWPKDKGVFIYIISLGWLIIPFKNIIKIFTELPLCFFKESLAHAIKWLDKKNDNSDKNSTKLLAKIGIVTLIPFQLSAKSLWGLMRIITSPIKSTERASKIGNNIGENLCALFSENAIWQGNIGKAIGYILGGISIALTTTAYIALIIATIGIATPFIAEAMGITSISTFMQALPTVGLIIGKISAAGTLLSGKMAAILTGASLATGFTIIRQSIFGIMNNKVHRKKTGRRRSLEHPILYNDTPNTQPTGEPPIETSNSLILDYLHRKISLYSEEEKSRSWKYKGLLFCRDGIQRLIGQIPGRRYDGEYEIATPKDPTSPQIM